MVADLQELGILSMEEDLIKTYHLKKTLKKTHTKKERKLEKNYFIISQSYVRTVGKYVRTLKRRL